jgi:hypothetical protein
LKSRYIQETLQLTELDPVYRQFSAIFETFRIAGKGAVEIIPAVVAPILKKAPKPVEDDEMDELDVSRETLFLLISLLMLIMFAETC